MNQWGIAFAVALGLTVAGCAEGVDDPQPAPLKAPAPAPAQQTPLQGDLPDDSTEEDVNFNLPPRQLAEQPLRPAPDPGLQAPAINVAQPGQ
jgi:hypothetical protein